MIVSTAAQAPYHRLATHRPRPALRAFGGTLYVIVGWVVLGFAVYAAGMTVAAVAGHPIGADGTSGMGPLFDNAVLCLAIAALLPVTLTGARWVQARHAGGLSSVIGRLRWRWLFTCLGLGTVATIATLSGGSGLMAATGVTGDTGTWVGWGPFALSMAVLVVVVPLQAAAEEYGFRGWLLQALGAVVRRPWIPIGVQAVLFAALHGWGTPWGFADLVIFGLLAGWLTVRTGGIEAAVALHVANNLLSFTGAAAFGLLGGEETVTDAGWQVVVVDVPVLLAYTAVVLWLARRRRLAVVSPPAPAPWAPTARPDQAPLVGERDGLHPVA
jgi:membrane protease YdiL (CAAX protease family)